MCIACIKNPIDFLDSVDALAIAKKHAVERLRRFQARLIKDRLKEFWEMTMCPAGMDILAELQRRQYELSKTI